MAFISSIHRRSIKLEPLAHPPLRPTAKPRRSPSELLDQGVGLRDIVKRCRVTPERARALAIEWKKMGSGELVISAEVGAEISRVLGGAPLPSCDALLRAVRAGTCQRV
jgi:hypothetical protein